MKFTERKIVRRLLITITFCFLMGFLPLCAYGAEYTDEEGTVWQYSILSSQAAYPNAVCINGCSAVPEDADRRNRKGKSVWHGTSDSYFAEELNNGNTKRNAKT